MSKIKLLTIHKWLGLFAGIFILVMSLSGAVIVFDDEIESFLNRDIINQPNYQEPVSIDKAYQAIRSAYPTWDIRIKSIPEKANQVIKAEVRHPDARRYLYLDPVQGKILRDLDSEKTFSYWMLKLHYKLHAGFWGEVIVLLAGLMLLFSLITGFWFYRKSILKTVTFKKRPRFRKLKTFSSEMHRFIGVWALIFNLVTVITGFVILLIIVLSNVKSYNQEKPLPNPPTVEVSLDHLIEKARETYPGFDPFYIEIPDKIDGKIMFFGHMNTDLPIHYEFSNYVAYDPHTGEESKSFFIKDQPFYMDLLSITYPLHFGDWGGILIKIIYSLFGIAPAILTITGFIIWRQRNQRTRKRKEKQRKRKLVSNN